MATKPVDFRKGAEGLATLVRERMLADPFSGTVYVFRAKRADRIKLTKDSSGMGAHRGHHHFVPMGLVADIEGDRIRLSANADVAVTMFGHLPQPERREALCATVEADFVATCRTAARIQRPA